MLRALMILLLAGWLPFAAAAQSCPRIISQAPYITKTLRWLGIERCIVGVSRYDPLQLPHTGGILDPDAAAIAALHPELMFNADWLPAETWERMAPPGAQAVLLHGFQGMAQIAANLRMIGRLAGLPDIDARATAFETAWRARARAVNGRGKPVLLLSACGGLPYSYGRNTWLYDLFTEAGFRVVEPRAGVQKVESAPSEDGIAALIDKLHPAIVFALRQDPKAPCHLIRAKLHARIVPLDGEQFLSPAPQLLDGLDTLQKYRDAWAD